MALSVTKPGVGIRIVMRIHSNRRAAWAEEIRTDLRGTRQWLLRNEDAMPLFVLIFSIREAIICVFLAPDEMRQKSNGDMGNRAKHYNAEVIT